MTGFTRSGAPRPLSRDEAAELIKPLAFDAIAALLIPPTDPFGIESDCLNPGGHQPIPSCRDLVCPHCGKVFWR